MSVVPASADLSEFIRERSVADGSYTPIAFLLTPVGASAPFYCAASSWSTSPIPDYGPLTPTRIVSLLYRSMMAFNMSLITSLKATHPNDRSLARASVTAAGCTEWCHGIIQAMLFDKLDWAVRSYDATTPILCIEQTPYMKPAAIPKQAERMWEIYQKWPETASSFVTAWITSESEDIEMSPCITISSDTESTVHSWHGMRSVVESLVRGTEQTSAAMHINLVENNFCWAALGLLAILLRASDEKIVAPTLNNGATVSAISGDGSGAMPKKRLTEYLAENCGHLPREIAGLADYDLLRPLYALAGISPIVLLSKLQITATGKCKVGLSHLAELITHPSLNEDRSRRYIEGDLFRVLIQMAVKGRPHFKTCMGPVIQRWRDHGVVTESNTVAPEKAITEIDLAGSLRRAQETRPAGFRMIRNIAKVVEKIGRRCRAKRHEIIDILEVRDLTGEKPPWLASALVSEAAKKTSPLKPEKLDSSQGEDTNTKPLEDDETRHSKREKKGVERGLGGELGKLFLKRNRKRTRKPELASEDEYSDDSQSASEKGRVEEGFAGKGGNKRGAEDDIELNDETSRTKKSRYIDDSDESIDSMFQLKYADFSKPPPGTTESCTFQLFVPMEKCEDIATSSAGETRSSIIPEDSSGNPEHNVIAEDNASLNFGSELMPLSTQSQNVSNTEARVLSEESIQCEKSPCNSDYIDWKNNAYDYQLETKTVTIPVWPSMRQGFWERKMLLKASIGEKRHTKTILRKDWERLSFAQRREVFTHANVHISGPPQKPLFGIQDWSSPGLDGLLDLAQLRQVNDMTVPTVDDENTNLRRARLGDMIKYITNIKEEARLAPMEGAKSKLGAHCLNALDIPLPGADFPIEFDDCSRFLFQTNGAFKWRTKLGLTSLANHWGLLALQSARSGAHIDAGGGCSIIHMLLGSKEWLIATSASMLPGPCGWRPEDSAWEAVYLRPGDDLLLQPGTVHSDITMDDCFATGGHFYFSGLFDSTLKAMVVEHYRGKWITNTEHTRMPMLLLKALAGYAETFFASMHTESIRFPDPLQLAFLFVIIRHLDQLGPELAKGANERSWTDSSRFKADFAHARGVLRIFLRDVIELQGLTFQEKLRAAEDAFAYLVLGFNEVMDKTETDKVITCICMCRLRHVNPDRFKVDNATSTNKKGSTEVS